VQTQDGAVGRGAGMESDLLADGAHGRGRVFGPVRGSRRQWGRTASYGVEAEVSPRTVLRRHARLVRRRRADQRGRPGRPRTQAVIRRPALEMARDDPTWGYTARCTVS
jgi:hypothetical protein